MDKATPSMTCVFSADVRSFDGNPFRAQTPFGSPRAISDDDALAELDRYRNAHDALVEELIELAEMVDDYAGGHVGWTHKQLKEAAEKALVVARTAQAETE